MKKGELIILNGIFSNKMKRPALSGDELYTLLSAKADISALAKGIEDKAENIRLSTKPDGVDEYTADQRDPRVQQWMQQYLPMQTRLYNEELEAELPAKCIQRDAFAQMCAGLTPGEAELVMKHLVV